MEWNDSASIALDPVVMPATSFAIPTARFVAIARRTVRRLSEPVRTMRPLLNWRTVGLIRRNLHQPDAVYHPQQRRSQGKTVHFPRPNGASIAMYHRVRQPPTRCVRMSLPAQEFPDRIGLVSDGPPTFTPYIAPETNLREFTPLPIIVGAVLGLIFGASSLYLVLKVGLTVSASIPVAVISITVFRLFSRLGARDATILEHNIVQTAGSAGESIAFGVGVTMPAILILGFDLEITRVMLVAILGGLLGILMMIPLRRALIVAQHGILKYPEGTACAEVLKAGASAESRAAASPAAKKEQELLGPGTSAKTIFTGFGFALAYKSAMVAFQTWKEAPEKIFGAPFRNASISAEVSPELLGVGYIIGPRIASIMCAGGVLAYLVLIPAIKYFGAGLLTPLAPETTR